MRRFLKQLQSARASSPEPATVTCIAAGMRVRGHLVGGGHVIVEGAVTGTVRHPDALFIAPGGQVVGHISAAEVIVAGEVRGNIVAESRLEVQAGGVILGDVCTTSLLCEEGAVIDGVIRRPALPDAAGRTDQLSNADDGNLLISSVLRRRALKAPETTDSMEDVLPVATAESSEAEGLMTESRGHEEPSNDVSTPRFDGVRTQTMQISLPRSIA